MLFRSPAVAECAVIGVPDEQWGEVGKAVVVLKPGAHVGLDEILLSCRGKLAKFKIPRWAVAVDALPRTGSGKVDKMKLRATFGSPSGDS